MGCIPEHLMMMIMMMMMMNDFIIKVKYRYLNTIFNLLPY